MSVRWWFAPAALVALAGTLLLDRSVALWSQSHLFSTTLYHASEAHRVLINGLVPAALT